LVALSEVDVILGAGEIVGLIGPNGAGKTTMLNVISGFQAPTRGSMWLDDIEITGLPPRRRAQRGISRTFQGERRFRDMTVLENVQVAGVAAGMSRRRARRAAEALLEEFGLARRAGVWADSLTHGEERRLGLARAVAIRPRFLLVDEPAAGLNEDESDELVEAFRRVRRERDVGILLVEHDMRVVMSLCDRIQVLDHGATIASGDPEAIRRDERVREAYLGRDEDA
jgi:branched-chain amino acid transport system ATP-binding protein